jgi:hypothetical protein
MVTSLLDELEREGATPERLADPVQRHATLIE